LENTPVIIHGGPFANIAHGCNSVLATRYGLKLGNLLITEAGFGADLGAEKFFDIKCRLAKLKPAAAVIVTTLRSLKYNGGVSLEQIKQADKIALEKGMANLKKHLENLKKFNVPVLVALNAFPTDKKEELEFIASACEKENISLGISRVWKEGGRGGEDLAKKLIRILEKEKSSFHPLYPLEKKLKEKIETIAKEIYGAKKTVFSRKAEKEIAALEKNKLDRMPICIAKTQYSFSDNPKLLGCPKNFTFKITGLRISNGAGFIVALAGDIMTMPGLPKNPAAEKINLDDQGKISGLF
jgi:formate--tetrahydrofolate ligase